MSRCDNKVDENSLLGPKKLASLEVLLQSVQGLPGAAAEIGVYRGGSARLIAKYFPKADVHLFDTFGGMPVSCSIDHHRVGEFADTTLEHVRSVLGDCAANVHFHVGMFPDTAKEAFDSFSFVHIDGDQYQTTRDAIEFFYPRLVPGGVLVFDDYQWKHCPGVERAIGEFLVSSLALPGQTLETPCEYQAVLRKPIEKSQSVMPNTAMHLWSDAKGLGDAVCGLYAACGAANAGFDVVFHAKHLEWFSRVSHPRVSLVPHSEIGVNINPNYSHQLIAGQDRKQWYCDAISRFYSIPAFQPGAPENVDSSVRQRRIDAAGYVLLAPFSAWKTREWPSLHWARLAHLFREQGTQVIAIGAERDGARLREIFRETGARWHWGQPADSVLDVICGASLVIGNDSGIPHVAGLHRIPTIAVHSHMPARVLWSHTNIRSVEPTTDCAGCRWQRQRGYSSVCEAGCSALASVSAEQVIAVASAMI